MSHPTPTRISKIYDHLMAQLATALPCHIELADPEEIDENPPEALAAGFGLTIRDGENTNLCISVQEYYHRRDFEVIIIQDAAALGTDGKTRREKWKAILESLHCVMKQLAREVTIWDQTVTPPKSIAFKSMYTSDSGPRATFIKGRPYMFIEMTVSVEYREPTTGGN